MNQELFQRIDFCSIPNSSLASIIGHCGDLNVSNASFCRVFNIKDDIYYVFDPKSHSVHKIDAGGHYIMNVIASAFTDNDKAELFAMFIDESSKSETAIRGPDFEYIDHLIICEYFAAML